MNPLRQAAIEYVERGWRIVMLHHPVRVATEWPEPACSCFRRLECRTPGKHPFFRDWAKVAATDPDVVRRLWDAYPKANVGLATGVTRAGYAIVVVDIDGERGRASLDKLTHEFGPLPETLSAATGREGGGGHYYFQLPIHYLDRIRTQSGIAPGIDIRAAGGMVVLPPSLHPSGARYRWLNDAPIAELPDWIGRLTRSKAPQQRIFSTNGARPDEALIDAAWPIDQRVAMARAALLQIPPAIQGHNGSKACLHAAITVVRGYLIPVDGGLACDLLEQVYNPRCVPPWSEGELIHKINSASTGVDVPWGYRLLSQVDTGLWSSDGAETPRQRLMRVLRPEGAEAARPMPMPIEVAPIAAAPIAAAPIAAAIDAADFDPDEYLAAAVPKRPIKPSPFAALWAPYPTPSATPAITTLDDNDEDECA